MCQPKADASFHDEWSVIGIYWYATSTEQRQTAKRPANRRYLDLRKIEFPSFSVYVSAISQTLEIIKRECTDFSMPDGAGRKSPAEKRKKKATPHQNQQVDLRGSYTHDKRLHVSVYKSLPTTYYMYTCVDTVTVEL